MRKLIKPVACTAGLIGFLQASAWTAMSLVCILCYFEQITDDLLDIKPTEYYKYIYGLYLSPKSNENSELLIQHMEFSIFMWIYMFLSFSWLIISGTLIWAIVHNQWQILRNIFGLWSIAALLISVVDAVFTGLLGHDYKIIQDIVQQGIVDHSVLVAVGIVLVIAARGFVLWVVNVVFAGVLLKFMADIISNEKTEVLPIINGYEPESSTRLPWQNLSSSNQPPSTAQSDLWPHLQDSPKTAYENTGFDYLDNTNRYYYNNTQQFDNAGMASGNSFADAIASNATKIATIGRNKGKRSPVLAVNAPVIPEPDYDTPPTSPKGLKSVLRSKSHYY